MGAVPKTALRHPVPRLPAGRSIDRPFPRGAIHPRQYRQRCTGGRRGCARLCRPLCDRCSLRRRCCLDLGLRLAALADARPRTDRRHRQHPRAVPHLAARVWRGGRRIIDTKAMAFPVPQLCRPCFFCHWAIPIGTRRGTVSISVHTLIPGSFLAS